MQTEETCQTNCTKFSIIEESKSKKEAIFHARKGQKNVTTTLNKSNEQLDYDEVDNGHENNNNAGGAINQKVDDIMTQKRNKLLTLKLEKAVEENFPSNQKTEEIESEKFVKSEKLTLFSQQLHETNSKTRFLSRTLSGSATMSSLGNIFLLFHSRPENLKNSIFFFCNFQKWPKINF